MARPRKVPLLIWQLLAAALGGVLAGPALPKAGLWWLIFPAVALIHWSLRPKRLRHALLLGFVAGFAFYASQSPWLTTYLGPVPWLALSVLEALIFMVGALVSAFIWQRFERSSLSKRWFGPIVLSLLLASSWVAREWLAGHWPYGGYQWSRLAQTQADTVLAKWAYWGGLSAISFAVTFAATLVLLLLERRRLPKLSSVAALLLVVAIPAMTAPTMNSTGRELTVALVQGNANAGLFANPEPGSILAKHLDVTKKLVEDPKFDSVQLVIWPENASDIDPTSNTFARSTIRTTVDNLLQRDLLLGAVTQRGPDIYNTTLLYRPAIGLTDWYDKQRPVPFGEYVPDRDLWYSLAPDLVGLISHGYSFGSRDGVLETSGTKVGSLICFEIAIDDVVNRLVADGAQLIASQANNSDFGYSEETFQQEALARLQAISSGRAIAHVSTVGVTEFILPDGSVAGQVEPFTPDYTIQTVPLNTHLTPAQLVGNWPDTINIALLVLSLLLMLRVRRKRLAKPPSDTASTA